jgi:hypothetical protein
MDQVQRRVRKKSNSFLRKLRYMNKLKISSREKEPPMRHIHLEISSFIS